MDTDSSPSPFQRLARALELHRLHREAGAEEPAALLAQHPELRELLEPLLFPDEGAQTADEPDLEGLPARAGDFRLLRVVGRGGMGVVFEAEQVNAGSERRQGSAGRRLRSACHRW